MGSREYEKRSHSNVSFINEKDRLQCGPDNSAGSKRKHSQYDTNQSYFNPNGPQQQQASQKMIEFNANEQRQSTPKTFQNFSSINLTESFYFPGNSPAKPR